MSVPQAGPGLETLDPARPNPNTSGRTRLAGFSGPIYSPKSNSTMKVSTHFCEILI